MNIEKIEKQKQYRREYYQKHKEHIKALVKNRDKEKRRIYVREYSQRPIVKKRLAQTRQNYYKNNKEKVREYKKKNKEKIREYQRQYYLKNKKPALNKHKEEQRIKETLTIRFD